MQPACHLSPAEDSKNTAPHSPDNQLVNMNLGHKEMTDRDKVPLHVVHPTHSNKVLSDNGHSSLMMVLKKQRLEIDEVIPGSAAGASVFQIKGAAG